MKIAIYQNQYLFEWEEEKEFRIVEELSIRSLCK